MDRYRKVRRAQREAKLLGLTGRPKRLLFKFNRRAVQNRTPYVPFKIVLRWIQEQGRAFR